MPKFKKAFAAGTLIGFLATVAAAAQPTSACCKSPGLTPSGARAQEPGFKDLPGTGQKCWIGEVYYFVYDFDKLPRPGPSILRIRLFDREGKPVPNMDITGRSDMPSLRGTYDSGEVAFKPNAEGEYLLPVNIVMPGRWEIRLTFSLTKIAIFRGRIVFDV